VMWGDKTTTPAGHALKHYASIRCHIVAIGKVKEKMGGVDVVVSSRNKVSVKKNKTAPPFRVAEFCISFGHGIDSVAAVLDTAIAMKIVIKRGAWFSFETEQLGCGRAVSLELMRTTPELTSRISTAITNAKALGVKPEIAEDVEVQDPNAGVDPDSIASAEEGAEAQDV